MAPLLEALKSSVKGLNQCRLAPAYLELAASLQTPTVRAPIAPQLAVERDGTRAAEHAVTRRNPHERAVRLPGLHGVRG